MSEGHKLLYEKSSSKATLQNQPQQQYPATVRRMRNTAVLVKWIEDHQSNPYPTKAEKQYLAYYSGMNLTQLSTWFANARRRIKKIGMKTWLEGRSTFTVDFFPAAAAATPASAFPTARPASYSTDYLHAGGSYNSSNPYASIQYTTLGNHSTNQQSSTMGLHGASLSNPYSTERSSSLQSSLQPGANYSLYASTTPRSSLSNQFIGVPTFNWSSAPPPLSTSISSSRASTNTGPTLHSPITAQVYSADHRGQATLDLADSGYTLSQPSPDQMIPECASGEPMLQGSSPKTHYSVQAD